MALRIPAGARDGDVVTRVGEGAEQVAGGPKGDLHVQLRVRLPAKAEIDGDDLHLELPLTVPEAFSGASIRLPTPRGELTLTVPAGTDGEVVLRVRGRGLVRRGGAEGAGDLLLHPVLRLPDKRTHAISDAVAGLRDGYGSDPRRPLMEELGGKGR